MGQWTLPQAPSAQTRPPFRKPSPGAWSKPGPRDSFTDSQCRRGDDLSSPVLMLEIFSLFGIKGSVHKCHPEKPFQHYNNIHENNVICILFKACLFKLTFYKGSNLKGLKQRALHVYQRKTKHFIAKLLAQPFMFYKPF